MAPGPSLFLPVGIKEVIGNPGGNMAVLDVIFQKPCLLHEAVVRLGQAEKILPVLLPSIKRLPSLFAEKGLHGKDNLFSHLKVMKAYGRPYGP